MGMNKRVVVVVVVLAVVIAGAIGALALTRIAPPAGSESAQTVTPEPSETPQPSVTATAEAIPGSYIDYTDTAIADAEGRRVLFFHAPWCPQCVELEAGILSQGVPDGVTIIKIDWDTHQDLEALYGVPMRTTFVELDAAGEVVQRYTAYDDPRFELVADVMNL